MKQITLFNSPLETGLRILFILDQVYPKSIDTQRLIYYSYLSLNTGDFSNIVSSLHPAIPYRSSQIIIQREILQEGIKLLQSKELIGTKYNKTGINFVANKNAKAFKNYFQCEYSQRLSKRIKLVLDHFGKMTDNQLNHFMKENLTKWGSEFVDEVHS